ncbi:MAG: hypothetical protein BM557_06000 [Flavobacterium sp. MedPE-SWcel]|uniref:hypothetical protein n=1 Tax=uncultured Flavobacterium sp. TaxID=165435 RepID=UPI000912547D|nr:hypothetical protein [uncultured Flavobacterium sp.]OIQ20219.1 MAG: hypothetical protein BM557_06000 [Flavobacterium sp. MedPE-SWcel]
MKYIYPFAALLLFLTACKEEKKEEKEVVDRSNTDWVFHKLEGDVKSITTKSNKVLNTNLDLGETKHENSTAHNNELQFDENGVLILEKKLNSKGGAHEQITYKGRDRKLEQVQYISNKPGIKTIFGWDDTGEHNTSISRKNADNSQIDRKKMRYENGNLVEKMTYNGQDNPIDRITYIYDNNNNLVGENLYLGTEFVQIKNTYQYNDSNQKTANIRYNKESEVIFNTQYEYDEDNLTLKKVVNKDGEVEYLEEMVYDTKGNITAKITMDKFDTRKTAEKFEYDNNNNKISWLITKDGETSLKVTYRYNDEGDLLESHMIRGADNFTDKRTYTYTYDDEGNWTQKIITINDVPSFIEKRSIIYHN